MTSRRYLKRIWRVPKNRGPVEYFATLVEKALRKHGWPATWRPAKFDPSAFFIADLDGNIDLPPDFANARSIAVRVMAKSYRVDVTDHDGFVTLNRPYVVTDPGGHFREVKNASV